MKKLLFLMPILCLLIFKAEAQNVSVSEKITETRILKGAQLFAGTLNRIDSFPSNNIKPRPVDVWLPEDYSEEKKYAVLYMHDGQNLFDSTTTWNKQEWKVDEWATKLMRDNETQDFIVVGIHNIPEIRWQDLFPQKAIDNINMKTRDSLFDLAKKNNINVKFNGDNYLKFMVEELKPFIDFTYSTHQNREATFVAGSSVGGLMSMYAISEFPDVFGGAACLSTHWVGGMPMENNPYPEAVFNYMEDNLPTAEHHKLYFDYGNKTLDQYYPKFAPRVDTILKEKGYTDKNSKNLFFEETDHSENSWNQRFDEPLIFLLGIK